MDTEKSVHGKHRLTEEERACKVVDGSPEKAEQGERPRVETAQPRRRPSGFHVLFNPKVCNLWLPVSAVSGRIRDGSVTEILVFRRGIARSVAFVRRLYVFHGIELDFLFLLRLDREVVVFGFVLELFSGF